MLEALILCAVAAGYLALTCIGMALVERHKRIRRRWRIHAERRQRELAENEAEYQARLARQVWYLEARNRELEKANKDFVDVKGMGKVKIADLMKKVG